MNNCVYTKEYIINQLKQMNAPTQLCVAKKMKETVELIFKNSDNIDPLCDEKPIPQKWYCTK